MRLAMQPLLWQNRQREIEKLNNVRVLKHSQSFFLTFKKTSCNLILTLSQIYHFDSHYLFISVSNA